jgi:hypothetical protein
MRKSICVALSVAILILIRTELAIAYDDQQTHPALTDKAILLSNFDSYLKETFGSQFPNGIASTVNGIPVINVVNEGSKLEDASPDAWKCRRSTHFFNPLVEPWRLAGLSDVGETFCLEYEVDNGPTRYSALTWATGIETYDGPVMPRNNQQMGWDNARNYLYSALTLTKGTDRESNFAKTFQAVGQVLHLLQDMGVPAHVRNDFLNSHIYTNLSNPYEAYVKQNTSLIENLAKTDVEGYIPAFTDNRLTSFWDTDQTPAVFTDPTLQNKSGLAEYTNANFVSEGTLITNSSNSFPYPSLTTSVTTTTVNIEDPFVEGWTIPRTYYEKTNDWDTGYLLAGTSALDLYQASPLGESVPPIPPLDKKVHADYAQHILPRVVAYSTALLDYFFRGTLDVMFPEQAVYAIVDGSADPQQFTTIKARVKNRTPDEEMGAGTLVAVAKYKKRTDYQPDLSADPPTAESREADFSYSVSASIDIVSLPSLTEFTFDFSQNPIPAGITDLSLFVVFKGTLGNEIDNAVAVGMEDLYEPQHLTIWNATDRFYLDGQLVTREDIIGDSTLLAKVDHDGNGSPDERINRYYVYAYLGFGSYAQNSSYQVWYNSIPPGRYGRILVLADSEYWIHVRWTTSEGVKDSYYNIYDGTVNAEYNGMFYSEQVYSFRDILQHGWMGYAEYYPDNTGIWEAPWPAAADLAPYPTDLVQ